MDLGLRDRVAIVTGSSQGIGKAIALGLANEGATVTLCARNLEAVRDAAREISTATGRAIVPLQVDLRRRDDIASMVEKTVARYGRIDVLINDTGGPPARRFLDTTDDDGRQAIDGLLLSAVTCSRAVIPSMTQHQWGRIINVTSFAAKQPAAGLILSNALRAGVLGLTKTLAQEVAASGILVNAVYPEWTHTRRLEALAQVQAERDGSTVEGVIAGWTQDIPLKRLARPDEIAHLVVFLASENARYLTGAVIQVDGGLIKSLT